jgi:hypothetical protein
MKAIPGAMAHGWGSIPVAVWIGGTAWQTSLFPSNGRFDLPLKASIRKAEKLAEGDMVTVRLEIRMDAV